MASYAFDMGDGGYSVLFVHEGETLEEKHRAFFEKYKEAKLLESVSDFDSDSDCDSDREDTGEGGRRMTESDRVDYNKQIQETMGFDVDVPDDVGERGIIKPCRNMENPLLLQDVTHCSNSAIDFYNTKHGTNFQFVKVVKANRENCIFKFYVTFEAMDGGQSLETFQAIVDSDIEGIEATVQFCRIKPKS